VGERFALVCLQRHTLRPSSTREDEEALGEKHRKGKHDSIIISQAYVERGRLDPRQTLAADRSGFTALKSICSIA
jgi:hypothetical protein